MASLLRSSPPSAARALRPRWLGRLVPAIAALALVGAPSVSGAVTFSGLAEGGSVGGASFGPPTLAADSVTFGSPGFTASVDAADGAELLSATLTMVLTADPGQTLGVVRLEELVFVELVPAGGTAEAVVSGFFSLTPTGGTPVAVPFGQTFDSASFGSGTLSLGATLDLTGLGATEATLQLNNVVSVSTSGAPGASALAQKSRISIVVPEPTVGALLLASLGGALGITQVARTSIRKRRGSPTGD